MIRLFALDLVPFLLFVGLVTGTWIYDREGFLPSGLIYAILFLLYEKLNRIEFSLSEDMREALLLKADHRFLYGVGKVALAGLVAAGLFYNQERSWVDVETTLARFGLASGQAAVGPAEAERAGAAWKDGLEEKGPEAEKKPVEVPRESTGDGTRPEPRTPEKAPERPETKVEAKDPGPGGADETTRVEEQPGQAKQEPPEKIEEPKTPARRTETATLEPKAEPRSPARGEGPPVSQFEFEED